MRDVIALEVARVELGLSLQELWMACFALGGRFDSRALGAYLEGRAGATDSDHDVIVHALNETFTDRGLDHPMPYRRA
jgi:hypothetical protein